MGENFCLKLCWESLENSAFLQGNRWILSISVNFLENHGKWSLTFDTVSPFGWTALYLAITVGRREKYETTSMGREWLGISEGKFGAEEST